MIAIICPYPVAKAPSQRFRFEQYLAQINQPFNQISFWNEKEWPAIYSNIPFWKKLLFTLSAFIRRLECLFTIAKYDLIFIHREATPIGPPWFEWCLVKLFRKDIIYDFDDAIWLPNASESNKKLVGKLKTHGKVAKICTWAKTVTVGNEFLAQYARQYCTDVRIIPTTIDTEHLHNPSPSGPVLTRSTDRSVSTEASVEPVPSIREGQGAVSASGVKVTIGWTGTHSTLKQLTPLFPLLEKINKSHPFRLLIIADIPPENMRDFMEFRKWNKATEIPDLMEFDIGIMPLFDTQWEYGKCGFKALQYMALEIPAIVSAVGVNTEIVQNGTQGFVVDPMPITDESAWTNAITTLLNNKPKRTEMGTKGRKRIEEAYSVKSQSQAYRKIFNH